MKRQGVIGKLATYLVASLDSYQDIGGNRLNVNGDDWNDNNNGYVFGMALAPKAFKMKSCKNLYSEIVSYENLF